MQAVAVDFEAIRRVVLTELHRQGIEFATVKIHDNYLEETHLIVETYTSNDLNPQHIEITRVKYQLESE